MLAFQFRHFFQRKFEWRVVQIAAEFNQRFLCRITELVRGGFGLEAVKGNLHLDTDSANLTAPVLHSGHQLGCHLAQFCGDCGIGNCDAERAELQTQNLCLAGLRKFRRGNADKMALQGRQSLGFIQ